MSKSKMRKVELGTHKPTENRADESMVSQSVNEWVIQIRAAERSSTELNDKINAVASVLERLMDETIAGKYSPDVIMGVVQRGSWLLSLKKVIDKRGAQWQRITKALS